MRIRAGLIATIIFTLIILMALLVGMVRGFMRETTGIDERWGGSLSSREELTAAIAELGEGIDDNIPSSPGPSRPLPNNEDEDGDGLPNGAENGDGSFHGMETDGRDSDGDGIPDDIENALGTDPNNPTSYPNIGTDADNPDTDGDGVSDGTEVRRGTDPNNPDEGGTAPPAKPEKPPHVERGRLVFDKVVKAVKEPGSSAWAHFVEVPVGTSVDMWIHIEVENQDSITRTIIIEDRLSAGLTYSGGGTYKGIVGEFAISLPNDWLQISHRIDLAPQTRRVIDINFPVTITVASLEFNSVAVYDKHNVGSGSSDKVFIMGRSSAEGQPPSIGSVTFDQFDKEVKEDDQTAFAESATASIGDVVDFRITIEVTNSYLVSRNLLLTDILPGELRYIAGQGNIGNLFSDGYLRIPVDPGRQRFTYNFSATVISGAGETVYNTAKVYESKFAPNGAIDTAEVIIR